MASITTIAPPWIKFLRADEWGRVLKGELDEVTGVGATYVHHSQGSNWHSNAAEAMRRMQAWYHGRTDPTYVTIAYNTMVHPNTTNPVPDQILTICEARGALQSGATQGQNAVSKAVCIMGKFHTPETGGRPPTARELEAICWAVAWQIELSWVRGDAPTLGHRDNPKQTTGTTCPGNFLYPSIGNIHKRAHEILRAASGSRPPAPSNYALHSTVQDGDGWWAIARRCYHYTNDSDVAEAAKRLEAANPNTKLVMGATVSVPGKVQL